MSEFISYQQPEKKPISKAVKYGLLFAVAIGGIGLAVHLGPQLLTAAEKKLEMGLAVAGKATTAS